MYVYFPGKSGIGYQIWKKSRSGDRFEDLNEELKHKTEKIDNFGSLDLGYFLQLKGIDFAPRQP